MIFSSRSEFQIEHCSPGDVTLVPRVIKRFRSRERLPRHQTPFNMNGLRRQVQRQVTFVQLGESLSFINIAFSDATGLTKVLDSTGKAGASMVGRQLLVVLCAKGCYSYLDQSLGLRYFLLRVIYCHTPAI